MAAETRAGNTTDPGDMWPSSTWHTAGEADEMRILTLCPIDIRPLWELPTSGDSGTPTLCLSPTNSVTVDGAL